MKVQHHAFVLHKEGRSAMETARYQFHFEGPEMQALATAAMNATQFREPYKHDSWSDWPAFWLVKEGKFYLMNAHPNPEGRELPIVVYPCEPQNATAQLSDDYVEYLPMHRKELEDLVSGQCGLFVSVGPTHCYAHRFRRAPEDVPQAAPLVVD